MINMKLLIIGKTGQLGSTLISDALSLNHDVIAPSRQEFDIEFDITDNDKFLKILNDRRPDIVINTAAFHNVPLCETEPLKAFKINCIAVRHMAEISNDLNIQFITLSTNYVFDGKKKEPYIESDTPRPLQIYGLSKLAGEYASLLYDNTIIIRTCALYGLQGASSKNGNFIDKRIKDSEQNDYMEISHDQTINPTYVGDLSKAILQLITHPLKESGIYHLVNEGYCTWYELTREIFNILNIDVTLVPVNREGKNGKIRRPLFSALKNKKARELGIELSHWKGALKNYLTLKYKKFKII